MNRNGLAIFDLDGTLFRADAVTVPAVRRTFEAHGLRPPPEEDIRSFIGRPTPELHAWLASLAPAGLGARVAGEVDRAEIALVAEAGALYPGVREALESIRARAAGMAICTNGPRPYVDAVVDGFGLRPFFDVVRHLEGPGEGKPDMVRELLDRMPARPAVMVGDRPVDLEAARANGLPAIGVTYGMCRAEELSAAQALAGSARELPGLVSRFIAAPEGRGTRREERS